MKIKYLIIALIMFIPQVVFASPNATVSTSSGSIENGKSVTVTVNLSDTAAWNIKIVGSGAATCSQKQADVTSNGKSTSKKFTLSCKATSEGTITIKVTGDITSGSGETKDVSLTKEVTVTKPKSSNNNLSDLKVNGSTVSGFSSSKTSYTLKDSLSGSISIAAVASDSKAKVSGTGSKSLRYGKNTFGITVTAENGSKKIYNVIITKPDPRSKNNYLKSLTVDQGTIEFNKDTTNYLIKVEHNVEEITISAAAEDSKAHVSGTGKKTLQDYVNEFKIIVKAENESTRTYTVKVARKDLEGNFGKLSTDNSVKSIQIEGYKIDFDKETKDYKVLVDEDVTEINFNVVPSDSKSSVTVLNNTDLKPGLNKVLVQVVAENGDSNEYLFKVYKIYEEKEVEPAGPSEDPIIEQPPVEVKQESKLNIWMIISIVEFVIMIALGVLLLQKDGKKR